MAGVVKEYRCDECNGIFSSDIPVCIYCGESEKLTRVFTQPFSFKSDKTKFSDSNLEHLTSEYGLTDFSNNQSTKHEHVSENRWAPVKNDANAKAGTVDLSDLARARGSAFPIDGVKSQSRDWTAKVTKKARELKALEKRSA